MVAVDKSLLPEIWLSPEGILARVILLDQFPRCVYRGTTRAFAYDSISVNIIKDIVQKEQFLTPHYTAIQRFFMCVALQHSEDIADQELGVSLASRFASGTIL
jgi:uncharacterized protein (DUF924 family)